MLVGVDEPLSDEELAELEALTAAATPGPWVALEDEHGIGGSSMIQLGIPGDFPPDMYGEATVLWTAAQLGPSACPQLLTGQLYRGLL